MPLPAPADGRALGFQLDGAPSAVEVRAALEEIVKSPQLRASPRLVAFLRYLIERTLAGGGDQIKSYTVAVEALGRDPSFDPEADPIVRVEAGRLRKALERYYCASSGDAQVLIEVPRGTYVPTFRHRGAPTSASSAAATLHLPEPLRAADCRAAIAVQLRELDRSWAQCQALVRIQKLQLESLAAEIAKARRTLRQSLALLRNAAGGLACRT